MNIIGYDKFISFCKSEIVNISSIALRLDDIDAQTDLLATGIIDSHSFIDLLLAIEQKTGVFVDISELDVDQFSNIDAIYKIISK